MIKAVIFDMYETLITHYNCPLYFSSEMAHDAGIPVDIFRNLWRSTEDDRSTGKLTLEQTIEMILRQNHRYSDELLNTIISKRIAIKKECFRHLHPEIIPMLNNLKEEGILIGLISNCFSEEAKVIRESILFPYFDSAFLSYEQGIQKPNPEIFKRCMEDLSVTPEECLYIGDGGSFELETARSLDMNAVQAIWYLKDQTPHTSKPMPEFRQLEKPLDVIRFLNNTALNDAI